MKLINLDSLVLEVIIPSYLNLKDQVNYFRALGRFTPELFFIKHVKYNKQNSLRKKKLYNEFFFIKYNLFVLSRKCMQFLRYHHWLYISALMPMKKDFILEHRDKLIVPVLVNNFNCFKEINLWTVDKKNLNNSFKIFNCWICDKKFTTYRCKKILKPYYSHSCYINVFQNSKTIKNVFNVYINSYKYKKLFRDYGI